MHICNQQRGSEEGRQSPRRNRTLTRSIAGTTENPSPSFENNPTCIPNLPESDPESSTSTEQSGNETTYDLDPENLENLRKKLIKTVNNLTRKHEALACLRDKTLPLDEKRRALTSKNSHGVTALFWAVRRRADHALLKKMVEIGRWELVLETNTYNENILHCAVFCGSPKEVFQILVQNVEGDEGGEIKSRAAIHQQDRFGNTPFHYACDWDLSIETIQMLVGKGGNDILLKQNHKGWLPCSKNSKTQAYLDNQGGGDYQRRVRNQNISNLSFFELIMSNYLHEFKSRLTDPGGRQEILIKDSSGLSLLMVMLWFRGNALPSVQNNLSSLIKEVIEIGGEDLIHMQNNTGSNALHYAAFNNAPLDIIQLIVETAGKNIIHKKNTGEWKNTPLHDACFRQAPEEVIEYLVRNQKSTKAVLAMNNKEKIPLDLLFDADTPSDSLIMTFQRAWYDVDRDCSKKLPSHIVSKTLTWCMHAPDSDSSRVTSNNFVKSLLNQRFILSRYQMVIMMDLYVQVAIVTILSPIYLNDMLVQGDMNNTWVGIMVLVLCECWLVGREFAQVYSTPLVDYVKSFDNYIDAIEIILVALSLRQLTKDDFDIGSGFRGTLVGAIAFSWLQLLFVVGQLNYNVSIFTHAFVKIVAKLIPFALTALLIVVAFSQMFFVAGSGTGCTGWQCNAYSSFFQSSVMFLTTDWEFMEWDAFRWEGGQWRDNNWLLTVIAFLFAIVIGLLLLNMLIAVVSNVFTKVTEASENAFWETRLSFMVEINAIHRNFYLYKSPGDRKSRSHTAFERRRSFAHYDDDWMCEECSEDDMEQFFKWWYYTWKDEIPPLRTRLHYFYKHASMDEIFFPGSVFMNILFGHKYDEKVEGVHGIVALAISYIHFFFGALYAVLVFFLGLVSFGSTWTKEVNQVLFFGPIGDERGGRR